MVKITEKELRIKSITDIYRGQIRPSNVNCERRHSDCLVYVLTGEATYFFEEKTVTAKPDSIIYLSHNSRYSIEVTDEHYTFIYVDFFFENPDGIIFENEIFSDKGIALLESLFEKFYKLWTLGDFADKIYCWSLLYQICFEITKISLSQYVGGTRKRQMEETAEYILQHISDKELSVSGLSKRYGISEGHFRRIFGQVYHTSPVKFITDLRIKQAKIFLREDNSAISEIADRCGFQNHYYFSKIFKSITNMTPSEYRRSHWAYL